MYVCLDVQACTAVVRMFATKSEKNYYLNGFTQVCDFEQLHCSLQNAPSSEVDQ